MSAQKSEHILISQFLVDHPAATITRDHGNNFEYAPNFFFILNEKAQQRICGKNVPEEADLIGHAPAHVQKDKSEAMTECPER